MMDFEDKKYKDDVSTQASDSDVANMEDLAGLDTDEPKNKFSDPWESLSSGSLKAAPVFLS